MESWFLCSEIRLLLASVSELLKKVKALDIKSILVSVSAFAAAATVVTSATTTDETVPPANAATVATAAPPTTTAAVAPPATAVAAAASPVGSPVFFALTFLSVAATVSFCTG